MKSYLRPLGVFLTIVAIGVFAWIFSLPSKAECVASGRVVDPTERHCEAPGGFQQLEEHALFHAGQVLLYAAVLTAVGLAVRFYVRRRSRRAGA